MAESPPAKRRSFGRDWGQLVLELYIPSFVQIVSVSTYSAVLPLFAASLAHGSKAAAGYAVGLRPLASMLLQLPAGRCGLAANAASLYLELSQPGRTTSCMAAVAAAPNVQINR